jgi:3-mercaptopyruvate sulfurtransferase SseA
MRTNAFIVLILSLLAAGAAVRAQSQPPEDTSSPALRIPYEEFKKLYDAKKIVVIDTRDERSYEMGHIPGSRVIPEDEIVTHVEELRTLQKPIVTYCS